MAAEDKTLNQLKEKFCAWQQVKAFFIIRVCIVVVLEHV